MRDLAINRAAKHGNGLSMPTLMRCLGTLAFASGGLVGFDQGAGVDDFHGVESYRRHLDVLLIGLIVF